MFELIQKKINVILIYYKSVFFWNIMMTMGSILFLQVTNFNLLGPAIWIKLFGFLGGYWMEDLGKNKARFFYLNCGVGYKQLLLVTMGIDLLLYFSILAIWVIIS